MAGNFMATLTRLSTMESADELARHAVNAILNKLAQSSDSTKYNGAGGCSEICEGMEPGALRAAGPRAPQAAGQGALRRRGVRTSSTCCAFREMIEQMGLYEQIGDYPVRNLLKLLETAPRSFAREWDFVPGNTDRSSAIAALDRSRRPESAARKSRTGSTKSSSCA